MSLSLRRLLPLFDREREAGRAMVLATVVHTAGPTYTKAGTLMVIAASGEYAGLLSGGCLEGDLAEHGRAVCIGESLPEAGGTWADLVDQAKHLPRTASSCFMSRALPGTDLLALIQPAPTLSLILGAGPDAQPVAELAVFLGWSVLVVDHREHYAQRARFPDCEAVLNLSLIHIS